MQGRWVMQEAGRVGNARCMVGGYPTPTLPVPAVPGIATASTVTLFPPHQQMSFIAQQARPIKGRLDLVPQFRERHALRHTKQAAANLGTHKSRTGIRAARFPGQA